MSALFTIDFSCHSVIIKYNVRKSGKEAGGMQKPPPQTTHNTKMYQTQPILKEQPEDCKTDSLHLGKRDLIEKGNVAKP